MGFFGSKKAAKLQKEDAGLPSFEFLHQRECKACTLNTGNCRHPQMPASGRKAPLVYILGEAPGAEEDAKNQQFIGLSGQVIRYRLPDDYEDLVRWNNVVRTRPPKNRNPTTLEIECCRPSVIRDIEESQPAVIIGFGDIPLHWAIGENGIGKWRGRRIPVQIGRHRCWFFPTYHPAYVLRLRNNRTPRRKSEFLSQEEFAFSLDIERAFDFARAVEEDQLKGYGSMPEPVVHNREMAEANVECITGDRNGDVDRVLDFLEWAAEQEITGFDYETQHLRPYKDGAKLLSVAIAGSKRTMAFALRHRQAGWRGSEFSEVWEGLKKFLRAPRVRKCSHNLPFEIEWGVYSFGREYARNSLWEDSLSQAQVIDERVGGNKPGCLGLPFLCKQYFGFDLKGLSNLNTKDLDNEPLREVLLYNGMDAKYHRLVFFEQDQILAERGLQKAYELMLRRVPTVVLSQVKGVPVDQAAVNKFDDALSGEMHRIALAIQDTEAAQDFRRMAGQPFGAMSAANVTYLIEKVLKLENVRKTKSGRPSSDEETIETIKDPIAPLILEYRKVQKQHSTYIKPLSKRLHSPHLYTDGLSHPQINTTFAETGRLSIEDPSWQNWPKREHKEIRRTLKAPANHLLAAFDYGQIEARVTAMVTKDPVLIKYMWDRYDIHTEWAERLARRYPAWIGGIKNITDKVLMKKKRDAVKNEWTFPIIFGAQPKAIAGYLGYPEDLITEHYDDFWDTYQGVTKWREAVMAEYYKYGFITYITGRRRHAPLSPNQLYNSPIQGPTADLVCDAYSQLSERDEWVYQANLQIHDDLTFVLPTDQIDTHAEVIVETMLKPDFDFINVPLIVEMSIGENWYEMEEVGKYSSDEWKRN